jgi:O-antigen/teichoic acid export membrane protein
VVLKVIGFALLYPIAAWGLAAFGYDDRAVAFYLVFFFYFLTLAVQDSLAAVFTARERMVVNGFFQGGTPIAIAGCVLAAIGLGGGLRAVGLGYVLGGLAVTGLWGAMTWKAERPSVRLETTPAIVRKSYLYGLTGLLGHAFYRVDLILLSVLATMPQVGVYAAAYKILDLAAKIPILGGRVVSPKLFQLSQGQEASYRRSADGFVRLSAAGGLLLAVACYPSADWLIGLVFGEEYAAAATILRILSASFALKFLLVALQTVLTTRDQHRLRTGALAVATAGAVLGHLVLIPAYGAVGAAAAVVAAECVLLLLYTSGVAEPVLRGTLAKRVLGVCAAGSAAALALVLTRLDGPAGSLLAVGVAAGALPLVGFVRPAEVFELWRGVAGRPADATGRTS